MSPLTLVEVAEICSTLSVLVGSQLQEIISSDRGLALGFYKDRMTYLIIDMTSVHPGIYLFDSIPFWKKSVKPKPVGLFLSSHAKNLVLRAITVDKDLGRVVNISLSNSTQVCELKIILIPKQSNIVVKTNSSVGSKKDTKGISWSKPRELSIPPTDFEVKSPREFSQIHEEWLKTFEDKQRPQLDPETEWKKKKEQQLNKKLKALNEIEKIMNSDLADKWLQLGELLKYHTIDTLPLEWKPWLDSKLGLKENRERAFLKSKQVKAKKVGQKERIGILLNEIEELKKSNYSITEERSKIQKSKVDLMKATASAGRTRKLTSGAVAYMGKSADDNLRILRAAKPWDIWLHLRDYPGAHAVIHKGKQQNLPESELKEIAQWVAHETLSKKSLALGQKINVIWVECRFVKPIKGDRHGRVNYHGERNLIVSYEKM